MTAEQASLLCKAGDSLGAAELLAERGYLDFAVSRAYYAMFYVAQAFLLGDGLAFSKHSGVIAAFGERFAKTGRVPIEYHRYLIDGQDCRTTGDYDTGPGLTADQAKQQLERAASFVAMGNRVLAAGPEASVS